MAIITWPAAAFDRQRGHMFPWAPVCYGTGIGIYFSLGSEPPPPVLAGLGAAGAIMLFVGVRTAAHWGLLLVAAGLLVLGIARAGMRTTEVAAPVLAFRYYGPIEGRLIAVDRSLSDAVRLTLDRVVLARTDPGRWPERVRVALHGAAQPLPGIGARVMLTGHLSPPQGPAEPGGFDFQRRAWFLGLGAVGYTRSPVLIAAAPQAGSPMVRLARLRFGLAARVRAALPGDVGGVAAAVMTGDRSGIGRATLDDLRAANLAHLLAISGLHMGLLTGFVFGGVRLTLAAVPFTGLRWPVKKIAALAALGAGAGYLALSGGSVATERAFVMVAVMLAAVLMDRRALTLRAVALAALFVLVLRPETLIEPGFQMSFAATAALVAAFGALRRWRLRGAVRAGAGLVFSSAIAGLATAPFAAAHFNQVSHYGLLANVLSVPVMGLVVVPSAVLAAILAPFGAGGIGLALMGLGLGWILGVAERVAAFGGALSHVPAPPGTVLPLIAFGALWIIVWRGRERLAGAVPVLAAFLIWNSSERPLVLISASGKLVGGMTAEGRAISKPRGEGFVARSWLENDGDDSLQAEAAGREGWHRDGRSAEALFGPVKLAHLTGRVAAEAVAEACAQGALVVSDVAVSEEGCEIFDIARLKHLGAVALYDGPGGLRIVSGLEASGERPWNASRARPGPGQ